MDFRDSVAVFLSDYDGVYADITLDVRRRELYRLAGHVEDLHARGLISTEDPSLMTVDDVKVVAIALKKTDMSVNSRTHMLGRLNLLCKHDGNPAVEMAKVRYPTLFPSKKEVRLDVLEPSQISAIIAFAGESHGWQMTRAVTDTLVPLSTGARPQEVRQLKVCDLDLDAQVLHISSVKASDLYGMPRTVPIVPPEVVPLIARYVDGLSERGKDGLYLFPGPRGEPVSGQTQRRWRLLVSDGCGVDYDHRILRRTWGQMLIDRGLSEEYVSVLLGHASTETTARYYARVRERQAICAVQAMWAVNHSNDAVGFVPAHENPGVDVRDRQSAADLNGGTMYEDVVWTRPTAFGSGASAKVSEREGFQTLKTREESQ